MHTNKSTQTGGAMLPSRIEIFKAGARTTEAGESIVFSEADIAAVAAGYRPALREAPLVVGHPSTDGPAYGWVDRLHAVGSSLYMDTKDVEPAFAEMVRSRRFPNRSVAFLRPDEPGNPTPGQWYLRHVGFLGAAAPALKGLKPISFSSGEHVVVFAEESFATTTVPVGHVNPQESLSMTPEQIAAMQAENARLQSEAQAAQQQVQSLQQQAVQFAQAQATQRHAVNVQFAEAQAQAGRVLPAERDRLVAVLDALGETKPVEFSEGSKTEGVDVLSFVKALVQRAAPQVQFGEHAPGGVGVATGNGARMTDEQAVAAARAHAAKHQVSFAEAYKAVVVDAGVVVTTQA